LKDFTDALWDILRIPRWKCRFLNEGSKASLHTRELFLTVRPDDEAEDGGETLMTSRSQEDIEELVACSVAQNIGTLERFEMLLDSAERTRSRLLREIGAYRQDWKQALRTASNAVIEGQDENASQEGG
jgi:hypothetical protein